MAENKIYQEPEELQDEQLDEVSGGKRFPGGICYEPEELSDKDAY